MSDSESAQFGEPTSSSLVAVFTTGGTIASTHRPGHGGLTPTLDPQDQLGGISEALRRRTQAHELARISSMAATPAQVFGWSEEIAAALSRPDIVGAVLTTGTNAMEEIAFLLDLVVHHDKPVVVTGAMRPPGHPTSDGATNLADAIRVALDAASVGLGVLVVMAGEIHTARHVRKVHASSLAAFSSPGTGPIGSLTERAERVHIQITHRPLDRIILPRPAALDERVAILSAALGVDSGPLHAAIDGGTHGIVIEAFAGGDVTPYMAEGIERARDLGIPVVVTSRAPAGEPSDLYAGTGEGAWLREHGVLLGRDLSPQKARLLLMTALGSGASLDLRSYLA